MTITEVTGGTTSSIKQFVWCGNRRCEARDGSSNLLAQYFSRGQVNYSGGIGTNYFYTLDHLGSVREMTNSSGAIVYQQSFDPYGQPSVLVSTTAPDFGYAGYHVQARAGLKLTLSRPYNSTMGRFISRDSIEEEGGVNLYAYAENAPVNEVDPFGTKPGEPGDPLKGELRTACEHNIARFLVHRNVRPPAFRNQRTTSSMADRLTSPTNESLAR